MDQTRLTRASDCGTARAGADLEAGRAGLTAWQTGLTHHGLTSSGSDGQFTVGGRRQCHGRRRGERHLAEFEPNYEWNAKITSVYSDCYGVYQSIGRGGCIFANINLSAKIRVRG